MAGREAEGGELVPEVGAEARFRPRAEDIILVPVSTYVRGKSGKEERKCLCRIHFIVSRVLPVVRVEVAKKVLGKKKASRETCFSFADKKKEEGKERYGALCDISSPLSIIVSKLVMGLSGTWRRKYAFLWSRQVCETRTADSSSGLQTWSFQGRANT